MINRKLIVLPLVLTAVLSGCNDDNLPTLVPVPSVAPLVPGSQFSIQVKNNTNNQPLSPVALISSTQQGEVFQLGRRASVPLERLAEGADNNSLIEASRASQTVDVAQSGLSSISSGNAQTIRITIGNREARYLTVASMLVNTNDGFFAEEFDLAKLGIGESTTFKAPVWDAGTELNTEAAGTIPGPADTTVNKVGFSEIRDDFVDFVSTHRGVITKQDGLITSVLNATEKFLNPSITIVIKRLK